MNDRLMFLKTSVLTVAERRYSYRMGEAERKPCDTGLELEVAV